MKEEGIKVTGRYRTIVKRADGRIETSVWKNTIHDEFLTKLGDSLQTDTTWALDNLFSGNSTPPTVGKDGIIIVSDHGDYYETNCSISSAGSYGRKITGVFTALMEIVISDAFLGYNKASGYTEDFGITMATPDSWSNITLQNGDQLTIEWTISFANS